MANTLGNRVKMSVSGTPGTGTITLWIAVSGFQTFAAAGIPNAATVPYVIEDGSNWEIGVGTYTSSGTTLARTSITASSNSGSAISATSGAIVMISPLAADLQAGTASGNLTQLSFGTWTPTLGTSSGSFTTASATGSYYKVGSLVNCAATVTITTNGTAGGALYVSLPFNTANVSEFFTGSVRENAITGTMGQCYAAGNASALTLGSYTNQYIGGSGYVLLTTLTYRSA